MSVMRLDVPYDVWLHITSYLPPDEVRKLYRVNHVLFGIAMDLRFKTGYIGIFSHSETHRSLTMLVMPELAARVREFTFRPADLCRLLLESKPKQYTRKITYLYDGLRKTIAGLSDSGSFRVKHPMPAEVARKNIVKIMGQMTSLRSLKVEILSGHDHQLFNSTQTSFFEPGWSAFGSSLREFDLNIPLEDMTRVLPNGSLQPQSMTPNLEVLSMSLRRALPSTEANQIFHATILPFIESNRHTLRSLAINVESGIDFSPLLLQINHISTLSSFRIKLLFSNSLTCLHHFLQTHRSHLTSLSLEMMRNHSVLEPDIFFAQECFSVKLPSLQVLGLGLHHFPHTYKGGMISYIHQFKLSLVSLSIDTEPYFWSLVNIQDFLKEFTPNILEELRIRVLVFQPALLMALSAKVPNLQILHLQFKQLLPKDYVMTSAREWTPRFCAEMSPLSFTNWNLRTLNIKPGLHLDSWFRDSCKIALVKSLPTVETFSGFDREEYLCCKNFV